MTDTIDTTATQVDPLLDKTLTLTFTVNDVNGILRLLGELPYSQSVGAIQAIHTQCAPQVEALNKEIAEAAPKAE